MGFEPKVLIVLGSDSDLPVMATACSTLEEFGVDYSLRILSAHRVPQEVAAVAGDAKNHYQVIIAAAGMAAHLPGVIAAYTTLPVICANASRRTGSHRGDWRGQECGPPGSANFGYRP